MSDFDSTRLESQPRYVEAGGSSPEPRPEGLSTQYVFNGLWSKIPLDMSCLAGILEPDTLVFLTVFMVLNYGTQRPPKTKDPTNHGF